MMTADTPTTDVARGPQGRLPKVTERLIVDGLRESLQAFGCRKRHRAPARPDYRRLMRLVRTLEKDGIITSDDAGILTDAIATKQVMEQTGQFVSKIRFINFFTTQH